MSGLVKLDKFSPSQTPYAFRPATFQVWPHGLPAVLAVWAGRKNGRTTASIGWLTGRSQKTFEEFIETADMRYGGSYEGKWDGVSLITPQAFPEKRRQALIRTLTNDLDGFPKTPPGFEGWYYRR